MARRRLDAELVRRRLAPTRTQAAELVAAGRVTVAGAPADKPARLVAPGDPVEVHGPPSRYVGRGGFKLEAALAAFGLDVRGWRTLDVGASTGGFTDCLLQHGAASVWAVDVGHGQLHPKIRGDRRVAVREGFHARALSPETTEGTFDLVVADLSFISLRSVAAALCSVAAGDGHLVVLVKPQFEAGRAEVSRGGGVVRDPAVWVQAVADVSLAFGRAGAPPQAVIASPLRGGEGNTEFLLWLRPGGPEVVLDLTAVISEGAG